MPNLRIVIQGDGVANRSRVLTRDPVAASAYTQLVMTDLAVQPRPTASANSARSAAPVAGRPFTTEAARWNSGVLRAATALREGLARVAPGHALTDAGLMLPSAMGFDDRIDRAAGRLTAAWLSGVLVGDLDHRASLLDAEAWFCGSTTATAAIPLDCSRYAQGVLEELVQADGALAMLPYALDPSPHEYRRDVVGKGTTGNARSARKASGSFFTPADVAGHIVDMALSGTHHVLEGLRLLDPASGTGVFLRAAFRQLTERGVRPEPALASLHAVDIDERCVDMAAFVLLVDYVRSGGALPGVAHDTWSEIRARFIAADTLRVMPGTSETATLFDRAPNAVHWLDEPFDVIVGNPPYARLGRRADRAELGSRFATLQTATGSTDIYPAFVELMCSHLSEGGAASMVVPMSIGYSSVQQIRRLRETMTLTGGHWTFEFYDRTPDALFGDDVKQRTAIVTRVATGEGCSVTTGPVMRWTSRNRSTLFSRLPRVPLGRQDIARGVAKTATAVQADVLESLRSVDKRLEIDLERISRVTLPVGDGDATTVFVASTAYNWLNVYRAGAAIARGVARPTASPLLGLTMSTGQQADALYAILSSRLTYWLWRVEGDAFHVPAGWVRQLPMTLTQLPTETTRSLARLGRALWSAIEGHPVESINGGSTTLSYCPYSAPELLAQVDEQLVGGLELPTSFAGELTSFVRDLTTAGRDSESEHGLRRALASWREA